MEQKISEKRFLRKFFFFSLAPALLWWVAMNVLEKNGYIIPPIRSYALYILVFVAIVAVVFFPYKQIPIRGNSSSNRFYCYVFLLFGLLWPLSSVSYGFRQLSLNVKTILVEEINQQMPYVMLKDIELEHDQLLDQVVWKEATPKRVEQMEYRVLLPIATSSDGKKRAWVYLSQWKRSHFEDEHASDTERESILQQYREQGRTDAKSFKVDSVLYFSSDTNRQQNEGWSLLQNQTSKGIEHYLLIPSYTPIQQTIKWLLIFIVGGYLLIFVAVLLFMKSDDAQ
ncbi:MAG: hypothetical protein HYZ44_17475 [Bacteroidetes bacterium]|nr:hypothetical protein [Bacteroidota bacterium]